MRSDLTLDPSFKVQKGYPNLKVLVSHLLVLEVSFDVVRFDLGPFLRGQTRIAKSKVLINHFSWS